MIFQPQLNGGPRWASFRPATRELANTSYSELWEVFMDLKVDHQTKMAQLDAQKSLNQSN